ncbi:hypothetical protein TESG_01255 [Trichophyton tonsurans CBS 112818]|uniref:Uncharacterized protein n=1 Tax=Trichophyton tonsurans (strain CBS 112818) TaxID=647933 RepID=F2RQX2_TRIT1|nr:hypothetical protein TESG_01255 [Trichophyton tonsurans CBS 112818]
MSSFEQQESEQALTALRAPGTAPKLPYPSMIYIHTQILRLMQPAILLSPFSLSRSASGVLTVR